MHLIGLKFYNIEMIVVENILIGRQMFIFFLHKHFSCFYLLKDPKREQQPISVWNTVGHPAAGRGKKEEQM